MRQRIIGHRGARNLWPENSIGGFRNALALGVDGIELDVHPSADGVLVVIHDPTLERTTGGTGPVAARTAAALGATRLEGGDGEGVPTLDAVLDLLAGSGIELHIELKNDAANRPYPALPQRVAETASSPRSTAARQRPRAGPRRSSTASMRSASTSSRSRNPSSPSTRRSIDAASAPTVSAPGSSTTPPTSPGGSAPRCGTLRPTGPTSS
jgi:hypothetical protein